MKTILAYVTDLFFEAKMSQTVQQVGAKLKVVNSLYKFLPELESGPDLVVIDLNAEGISPSALISQVKGKKPHLPVVVYGDSQQQDIIQRATQAGADQVLPRSDYVKNLSRVLGELES